MAIPSRPKNRLAIELTLSVLLLLATSLGCHRTDATQTPGTPEEPSPSWLAQAQSAIEKQEYHASESRRGLQAPNRVHGLRT